MIVPLTINEWQVLRKVARSQHPVKGTDLRLNMNRYTKSGMFLVELCELGLMEKFYNDPLNHWNCTYVLTEHGRYAAEYGEYETGPKKPA